MKGVLQSYEQSFQATQSNGGKKAVKISEPEGGKQMKTKESNKQEVGIPRLSTIKEDSPEFGPATENSDMVNHRSMQGKENMAVAYHFNQYIKQNA